jgi:16S rRNA (uracil1498-N3)-methyltransferase
MQVFYAPDVSGDNHILDEKESRHIIRVLRMKKGASVRLIDGKGNLYEGIITDTDQRKCAIGIVSVTKNYEKRSYRLHIAMSLLKNTERFEWFVEKSVEIGIDEITPLICRNTEKPGMKTERIQNIIISAMKQSLKAQKTILNEPCLFGDFLKRDTEGIVMLAHCSDNVARKGIAEVYKKGEPAVIMIGPEGDFSEEETAMAVKKGIIPIHLGNSRLRTETAGVAACHSVYFINQ